MIKKVIPKTFTSRKHDSRGFKAVDFIFMVRNLKKENIEHGTYVRYFKTMASTNTMQTTLDTGCIK